MKVFSIIVAYLPDVEALFRKVEILKRCHVVPVVVNNSAHELPDSLGCEVLELGDNYGIATAQNKGIKHVRALSADIIMFFDQDSTISESLVEALVQPIKLKQAQMTAPVFFDEKQGFFYKIINISRFGLVIKHKLEQLPDKFTTNAVISSGHTVNATVFDKVGLFADDFFIDYVDTEWCLRAAAAGFYTQICKHAVMQHSIGDKVINLKFVKAPVHSPYRRYYRIRNAFLLLRKKHVPVGLALREAAFSVVHQLVLIVACQNKWDYFRYLLLGVYDGIRGKTGKLS